MFEPEMIKILEGAFAMGTAGGVINETPFNTPFHEVYLDRFGIAKYPVTNQQYQAFLKANPNQPAPQHWNGCTPPTDRINNPVVNIIWDEAMAYTTWLSQHTGLAYRLPTEAEWEKAARGTDSRVYPWGMDFDASKCNTREDGPGMTTPVNQYPDGASAYGLIDMAGNVAEWCSDWYQEVHSSSLRRNPTGPSSGEHRIVRGGSWRYSASAARCAARYWCPPEHRRDNTGFRLAKSQ
ncbi:TPA: formylglycine-generating enzyme family protein [Candidatus Poribacteria bacterium]|nr:formylglycine-generating enzyme family protein [Candidatus Poribacteria bacterium]HIA69969.1 formylglycine-generating enzyme family protein [Candidatus Poribacteria bacterium]HIB85717.1 formylglycine-generating enzyme family protein [Candidatus Poribacteria bacterium]